MRGIFTKKTAYIFIMAAFLALLLTACGSKENTATFSTRTGSALKSQDEASVASEEESQGESDLYIVENLDMTEETITLYSISSAKQVKYKYNMTTKFADKYDNSSSWAQFTTGSVVTIGEPLPVSGALSEVKKADSVWVFEDVSNFSIDNDKNMLSIGDSNYRLKTSTKVYSDNEKILLNTITDNDVLTVIGQDKEILSIAVTTGHGYVHLTNTSLFNNSLIFIGNKIVTMIYGESDIEVPEGTYEITVANDGWGGSGEYTVVRNESTVVNLDDLKGDGPSYCELTFIVTVPDTYVYIDGSKVDTAEPVQVRYGSHTLVVECAGYISWNKTLVVNSASATITLELEEESAEDTTTTTTTTDDTEEAEDESSQSTEDSSNSSTDSSSSDYDYEVDYLSTISDLISNLMN